MQELMKQVKDGIFFLTNLEGKGVVMKNMTIGNTLQLPVINVLLDFVSYIQAHDNPLDWSSMRSWKSLEARVTLFPLKSITSL